MTKVDIDMEGQKVTVESTLSSEELLTILKKTGRECSYIGVKQWFSKYHYSFVPSIYMYLLNF